MKVVDEKNSLLQGFLRWRERHIKDKQFVLILSFFSRNLHGAGRLSVEVPGRVYQGVPDRKL